jgi:hypothetical protein
MCITINASTLQSSNGVYTFEQSSNGVYTFEDQNQVYVPA